MTKNWETEILTSLGMTVSDVGGGGSGIYQPPSALSETEKLYIKILLGQRNKKKWVGHVAHMEVRRGAYKVLLWKPEGKRSL